MTLGARSRMYNFCLLSIYQLFNVFFSKKKAIDFGKIEYFKLEF